MSTLPDTPAGAALAALLARRGQAYYDQFRTFHLALFSEHQAVIAAAGAERAAAELAVTAAAAQVTLAQAQRQVAEAAAIEAVAAASAAAASAAIVSQALESGPVSSVNGQEGVVTLTAADVGAATLDDLFFFGGE